VKYIAWSPLESPHRLRIYIFLLIGYVRNHHLIPGGVVCNLIPLLLPLEPKNRRGISLCPVQSALCPVAACYDARSVLFDPDFDGSNRAPRVSLCLHLGVGLCRFCSVLLLRIFIFFHDCTHGSFLPSPRWNRNVGYLCGLLTFTVFHDWRRSHAGHHILPAISIVAVSAIFGR